MRQPLALLTLAIAANFFNPVTAAAQDLRPDLMFCGSSSRTGTSLYTGFGPLNEVSGCAPTATTQAMLVTRSGSTAGQGAAWLAYLDAGGIIITEYSISDDVYNEIYGTSYPQPGSRLGDCQDNAMPSLKFNPGGTFWQAVDIPETDPNLEACGFPINAIVDGEGAVSALGGFAGTDQVNFAARNQGAGLLFLLDADWQDSQPSYTDDSRAFMGALIAGGDLLDGIQTTAQFQVTKTFSNGAAGDVEVTLTCNGGIPLTQSFTISGDGPGVTFTVTNLPDTGVNCEVTESGGPAGYTAELNGGSGCAWSGVTGGSYSCAIENVPEPTTVAVDTTVEGEDDPAIDTSFTTTIVCTNVSADTGSVFGTVTETDTTGTFEADWYAAPGETAECTATMVPNDMAVEGAECAFSFALGDEAAGCDLEGTVFFEGIPTLSQYGLALLALLMLGVGFVGMRRFG